MEDATKKMIEKISSYNIFNNLFPGIIFCIIVERITRISILTGEFWERLFVYYFVGVILSRIGSIFIEKLLESMIAKNRETEEKGASHKVDQYYDYIEASENDHFIRILNETNNTYRTLIAMMIAIIGVKLYDWLLYDWVSKLDIVANNIVILIMCLLIMILFILSYKKQTDFINRRVKNYTDKKNRKLNEEKK